ncbi:MAG: HAMP domain-containing histidine kinase [Actinomycetota bacterium]|nr:HAMP domain-containing histidine kinase [Actinomycetota bacterium]
MSDVVASPTLRQRTPLRTQLVLSVVALAALTVLVVSAAGAFVLRDYLIGRIDRQLVDSLRPLTAIGAVDGATANADRFDGTRKDPDDFRPPTVYFGQLYDSNGAVLGVLGSGLPAEVAPPAIPTLDAATLADVSGEPFTVRSASGTDWRVLVLPVNRNASSSVASVAVGLPLNDIQETVGRLLAIDLVVGAIALVILALVARWVVRSSLRPLMDVEETAEAIASGDLTQRVPVAASGTEVGRLSNALNTMLGRIEDSFTAQQRSEEQARASEDRMRRFVADASHELRTPLTTIRGFAELYRQGAAADPEHTQQAMQRIEQAAARMGLLVDDLLLLARLDQQRPLTREPVDLLALASDAVHDARLLSTDHPIQLQPLPGDSAPVVAGDPQRLRQVLTNLLSNAVHHTPAGTDVTVVVGVPDDDSGTALLEVRDAGPGLSPEDAERIFERFYRADSSRTRGGGSGSEATAAGAGGTGLGLAIVAALVAGHDGTVDVESSPGSGATFRVRLPLLPA